MVTSRKGLEEFLQNRLTAKTDVCEDTLRRMRESETDLFQLYAAKHHTDDTSSSSCCAEPMNTAIKREVHTPTTDQSEDSGVDVSATAAGSNDGRGPYCKRKRPNDDDYDECPIAAKSNRTADTTAAMLSVNMAVMAAGRKTAAASSTGIGCPPFRPWKSEESSSDVGLRLFHDIRNVDRILTLTQRHKEPTPPPPEPQPLDLTKGRLRLSIPVAAAETADRDIRCTVDSYSNAAAERALLAAATTPPAAEADTVVQATSAAVTDGVPSENVTAGGDPCTMTRYSKNMSRARRIEANARERSRVHTISAAFDTLRASIPSYSRNQKLSKLSTIRIASAYILTLSRLLDMDYSAEQDRPSVDECMSNITGIIHMEGKAKKRKDEQ
ncbi:Hypothetical protein CINCED_3A013031 [Cinara cedri]|uniref:BHLH domain-containing protein n=1 Tax=Cinara cedri TaxID=506608 RepID=A0A5E4MZC5_9HEMI|nr:Hypothetical protein CINCED_3A013031 [Cinara cedri]